MTLEVNNEENNKKYVIMSDDRILNDFFSFFSYSGKKELMTQYVNKADRY